MTAMQLLVGASDGATPMPDDDCAGGELRSLGVNFPGIDLNQRVHGRIAPFWRCGRATLGQIDQSFVATAADLRELRSAASPFRLSIMIAKFERAAGVAAHRRHPGPEADGIVVARGDLGVGFHQKWPRCEEIIPARGGQPNRSCDTDAGVHGAQSPTGTCRGERQ